MSTRIFSRTELDSMELPTGWRPEYSKYRSRKPGDALTVLDEPVHSDRWTQTFRLIFQAPDDGKHYEVYYRTGATEHQADTDPWDDRQNVEATEVELVRVTKEAWKPVGLGEPRESYTLNLPSCDDTNTLTVELTKAEAGLVCWLAEEINQASKNECQPKLHIQPNEES